MAVGCGHGAAESHPHGAYVTMSRSVAFSPDGGTLASGSRDRYGAAVGCGHGAAESHPHGAYVTMSVSVAFSPDGGTLASGSKDGTISLWRWEFSRVRTSGHAEGIGLRSIAWRSVPMGGRCQVGTGDAIKSVGCIHGSAQSHPHTA